MKKVLIITYYWPPAGGPGVQRWLKFVKYLRDFQIEPVVFVPENPSYPIIDESFKSEIPEDLKWCGVITGGLLLIFLLFKSLLFDFSGANDASYSQQFGMDFMSAFKQDR